jgi:hypothetical protein
VRAPAQLPASSPGGRCSPARGRLCAHDRAGARCAHAARGRFRAAACSAWARASKSQAAPTVYLPKSNRPYPSRSVSRPRSSPRPRSPSHQRRRRSPRAQRLAVSCRFTRRRGEPAPSSLSFPILPLPPRWTFPAGRRGQEDLRGELALAADSPPANAQPSRPCARLAVANRSTQQAGALACRPRAPSPCSFAQPRRRSSSVPSPASLVPARRGRVVARSARPATLTCSAVAAVRRRSSPLRVAAALLRAHRCPARPGRSSTFAVPCFSYLARRVLVSLTRAISQVITGIARVVVTVCRVLALFRACRARNLRVLINHHAIIVRSR